MIARLTGLALLALLWLSPLPALAAGSIVLHMVLHLAIIAVVPALLAPRLPVTVTPVFLAAAVALEMLVVWGWHSPAAHLWARLSPEGLVLEQGSFLLAGLLLWSAARSAGPYAGAAVMLATVMHMTLLGAIIGLAPRLVYGDICAEYLGLDALEEQQVAGALMALGGGCFFLMAALLRLAPALRARDEARA
ncbi:cytochrome c oxidase assembly protein [Sulfitobacter sp. D35]|uniref:cytochrome c oxidase assembly protein n=1 Tax=Sulfitobacter sp. D35 TaxID=3083252 RepID=UPI00296E39C3|nr:cytochrome c oxidase assembly protein [Sulfitobacter sp. D35]MDW4500183.1 cytochrome c oxidase assembly protein [Sulfitobacter sp. D35]